MSGGLWLESLYPGVRLCKVQSIWAASHTRGPCSVGYLEAVPWACEPLVRVNCFCVLLLLDGQGRFQEIQTKAAYLSNALQTSARRPKECAGRLT